MAHAAAAARCLALPCPLHPPYFGMATLVWVAVATVVWPNHLPEAPSGGGTRIYL